MAKSHPRWINIQNILISISLSGCAQPFFGGYGEHNMSRQEFTRYVESVFRLQNSITSEIMLLAVDEGKIDAALLQAEQHMQEACEPLNEYVSRESDGLSAGIFLRRRVEKSAIDCERKAQAVRSILEHH
jgi:hypothetical protein